jgi:predicted TIM-barrel fold metal-dependent hydrolase
MNRRQFLGQTIGAAAVSNLLAQPESPWGNPVLDIHLHTRPTPEADLAHIDGSGVRMAVLLTPATAVERSNQAIAKYPGPFVMFTSMKVTDPDAIETLRKTGAAGTKGLGELKTADIAIDSPEMRRVYELAAEMQVPVLIHFQDYPSQPGGHDVFNTGIVRLPAMLKAYPKTIFIGHGNSFWANISADVPPVSYPTGPIKPGGLTDKMLSDYPNLYGDLSANSGRNSLARDTEFATAFLARHQDKLMLGSDCPCKDGHGTGSVSEAPLIKGKCIARETLTALKQLTPPDRFRKITWENGTRLLKISV